VSALAGVGVAGKPGIGGVPDEMVNQPSSLPPPPPPPPKSVYADPVALGLKCNRNGCTDKVGKRCDYKQLTKKGKCDFRRDSCPPDSMKIDGDRGLLGELPCLAFVAAAITSHTDLMYFMAGPNPNQAGWMALDKSDGQSHIDVVVSISTLQFCSCGFRSPYTTCAAVSSSLCEG